MSDEYFFIKYSRKAIPIGPQIGDLDVKPRFREYTHEAYLREMNISAGGVGCACWDGAIVLSNWLTYNSHLVKGKTIHEVGAGVGLPGIVAARYARKVIISDYVPILVKNLEYNTMINTDLSSYQKKEKHFMPDEEFVSNDCFNHENCDCIGNTDIAIPHFKDILKELRTENENIDWMVPGTIKPNMDIIAENTQRCRDNVAKTTITSTLDWTEWDDMKEEDKNALKCDIILGTEVSYIQNKETLQGLLKVINDTLSDTGVVYLVQSTDRGCHDQLIAGMIANGFSCDLSPVPSYILEYYSTGQAMETYLYYTFRRPNSPYPIMSYEQM